MGCRGASRSAPARGPILLRNAPNFSNAQLARRSSSGSQDGSPITQSAYTAPILPNSRSSPTNFLPSRNLGEPDNLATNFHEPTRQQTQQAHDKDGLFAQTGVMLDSRNRFLAPGAYSNLSRSTCRLSSESNNQFALAATRDDSMPDGTHLPSNSSCMQMQSNKGFTHSYSPSNSSSTYSATHSPTQSLAAANQPQSTHWPDETVYASTSVRIGQAGRDQGQIQMGQMCSSEIAASFVGGGASNSSSGDYVGDGDGDANEVSSATARDAAVGMEADSGRGPSNAEMHSTESNLSMSIPLPAQQRQRPLSPGDLIIKRPGGHAVWSREEVLILKKEILEAYHELDFFNTKVTSLRNISHFFSPCLSSVIIRSGTSFQFPEGANFKPSVLI